MCRLFEEEREEGREEGRKETQEKNTAILAQNLQKIEGLSLADAMEKARQLLSIAL